MKHRIIFTLFLLISFCAHAERISVVVSDKAHVRVKFGAERLAEALRIEGNQVFIVDKIIEKSNTLKKEPQAFVIVIGEKGDAIFANVKGVNIVPDDSLHGKEAFSIVSGTKTIVVKGSDASGALYGCIELIERINEKKLLPQEISISDKPEMVMRGACIGVQKPVYLPGRDVYEYPYTPENFPWFYDKKLWIRYLDMLVDNRMNALYLWNGHPFASLVKLKDYPYAIEVDDSTFRLNEEMYAFLTTEANKRGIWVIQMFYNIIVSEPFAKHHNIKTQDRGRPIVPVIADYTRKSIAAFVEKYPNVGLLVCLGEAMNTVEDDVEWFTKTIIPGVQDGLKALGRTDEVPIILRHHDTDAKRVIDASLPIYKNLYTMHKYNGESLTTYQPRGPWSQVHKNLSSLGSVHIDNVHILANLEPFRYGSPEFIRKTIVAMHQVHGANGLHLYPQASYWDWPYTADKAEPRLLQIDRDWIWYKAWARYAWNVNRNTDQEKEYWTTQLGNFYGCAQNGLLIKEAYDQSGEIAPKLARRFGISDGNRQTLLLGMFMSQLTNPFKYRIYKEFYESCGPEGEMMINYVKKEWNKEPHVGETPRKIISEVSMHGKLAKNAIDKAAPFVTLNKEEFSRLKNDIYCYNLFAQCFASKVEAAMLVVKFKYSNDIRDLEQAVPYIQKGLDYYRELVDIASNTYLYANSMQTGQRRIPISGENGKNKTWAELLPKYKEELSNLQKNIVLLKSNGINNVIEPFKQADVVLTDTSLHFYSLQKGEKLYSDDVTEIQEVAPELAKLKGIRLYSESQKSKGTAIRFNCKKPIKVVVGYFNGDSRRLLTPPSLEFDASANNRGQADIRIANAIKLSSLFPVNIYTYSFDAGDNELVLGKGMVLVLGFMDAEQTVITRDAGFGNEETSGGIDWMFY